MFDPSTYQAAVGAPRPFSRFTLAFLFLFVVVISFTYGLVVGVRRPSQTAVAALNPYPTRTRTIDESLRNELPRGVIPVPMGRDVRISGRDAQVVSFRSGRPAADIIREVVRNWRSRKLEVVEKMGALRGLAIAVDRTTGKRYSIAAWTVPAPARRELLGGAPTQGTFAMAGREASDLASDVELKGEVPGVPLMPGGKTGSIFSSKDPGGRSYTGTYRSPYTVSETGEFYRSRLIAAGWTETEAPAATQLLELRTLRFIRGGEEILLVLVAEEQPALGLSSKFDDGNETLVTVSRGFFQR